MLSVIIPVLNAEADLPATLTALLRATMGGVVREVIVVDGGSTDLSLKIADEMGATIISCERGRGQQLAAGAAAAKFPWMLFLHADTELQDGWEDDVKSFVRRHDQTEKRAAAFTYKVDDKAAGARFLEWLVALRCRLLALPYGDQGLLIHRHHYDEVGGFGPLPLMEDVDMVRRIGRRRMEILRAQALTSARRYRESGYILRPLRNVCLLSLYWLRVPPRYLVKLYG